MAKAIVENRNNVLVALMNSKTDFEIAWTKHWYRIPVGPAPPIIKNNEIEYIAFYHTKEFEKEKYSVSWFAKVRKVSIVKRKELFPDLSFDPKAKNYYYKIEFESLQELPEKIISLRHRRLLFISTTIEKLYNAKEINFLFNNSPLEEALWNKLVEKKITAERQFYFTINDNRFVLDFAVFCKLRNINVECDGDQYHTNKENIQKDKRRSNLLESVGWSVLRFTTYDITREMETSVNIVAETINKYGGVQDNLDLEKFKYIYKDDDPRLYLFD
jgi:very-short-patch-repair endonuclease